MNRKKENRSKVLIADDSEMNRSILADMLGDEFEIVEAADGVQAVALLQSTAAEISLVLLDIVMPRMDGFEVLAAMNKHRWIEDVPVIMISAENTATYVERAYELGVTDYISRPFDSLVVRRRVVNTIMLYAKQKKLVGMVADQIYEREKSSRLMISILSHIVEFRNNESGLHVLHIQTMTGILLEQLMKMTDRYPLSREDISLISTASALHDIGKIAVPDEILNKPGRLTPEEFKIMKTHSAVGASMLEKMSFYRDEPLVKIAYEICRWHHERYDGRGYPDGLEGERIPISAQVVSLADVYDALTSERVYKAAYSHEKAIEMILGGECGTFNPLLLDCLTAAAESIRQELRVNSIGHRDQKEMRRIAEEISRHEELAASERTLQLLEYERTKFRFFASMSQEIQFQYTLMPPLLETSEWGAQRLGLSEIISDPLHDESFLRLFAPQLMKSIAAAVLRTTPENPLMRQDGEVLVGGEWRWHQIICRTMWSEEEPPRCTSIIGKLVDVHEERMHLFDLQHKASHDALTGLLDHAHACTQIEEKLHAHPGGRFVLALFDVDHFKLANQKNGHMFGDRLLQHLAEKLRASAAADDVIARVGGDEFMIFLADPDPQARLARVFDGLSGVFDGFRLSVSMGAALSVTCGSEYDRLFLCADEALCAVKRERRGTCGYYDVSGHAGRQLAQENEGSLS